MYALKIAYSYNGIGCDRGKGIRIILKPVHILFDMILFKKIRANFGGRLKLIYGGAAVLDIEIQKFFYAIGIPVYHGYGLSEASPLVAINNKNRHRLGSSGIPIDNLVLKICDENCRELPTEEKGEIVIHGENVMKGY
jgi:long-chain acyl-CoA synthetase